MKNPAELSDEAILTLAQELIRDPEHWTTCAAARDGRGHSVEANAPGAVRFCAAGAIMRVTGEEHAGDMPRFDRVWLHLRAYPAIKGASCPAGFNDVYGHEAVMRMFDFAREHARMEAA
jgi:hypothetical protein